MNLADSYGSVPGKDTIRVVWTESIWGSISLRVLFLGWVQRETFRDLPTLGSDFETNPGGKATFPSQNPTLETTP